MTAENTVSSTSKADYMYVSESALELVAAPIIEWPSHLHSNKNSRKFIVLFLWEPLVFLKWLKNYSHLNLHKN